MTVLHGQNIYLVEKLTQNKREPIAVCSSHNQINKIISLSNDEYLVTLMKLNENYRDGLGKCKHWLY